MAADHSRVNQQCRPSTAVDNRDRTYPTSVAKPLPIRKFGWSIPGIQPNSTRIPLSEVAANIYIPDFVHAAAVFVRHQRHKMSGMPITSYEEDRLEVDPSWVSYMTTRIHPSMRCWRPSGKRHDDAEHCECDLVRCAPNWQDTRSWRRDYVWVQEFQQGDHKRSSKTVTDGRVAAQVHLTLTIIDDQRFNEEGKALEYYN